MQTSEQNRRLLLDAKLTDLMLYAKELCPDGRVEGSLAPFEDEDGHVLLYPPPTLSEEEEDRIEMALARRAGDIFEETGLFIPCAVLDATAG